MLIVVTNGRRWAEPGMPAIGDTRPGAAAHPVHCWWLFSR